MICNFTIAMLHYPEIMRKAQAELDKVVGRERAPNFEDKNNLPYVQAYAGTGQMARRLLHP